MRAGLIGAIAAGGRASAGGGGGGGGSGHLYWRITSITIVAGGGYFEPSEIQVHDGGGDVTGSATKTSSVGVDSGGTFAAIFDGNLSTRGAWAKATVEVGTSFWIKFTFGAGVSLAGIKQGRYDTAQRTMAAFTLQYSDDDSAWTTLGSKSGIADIPTNNTLSALITVP